MAKKKKTAMMMITKIELVFFHRILQVIENLGLDPNPDLAKSQDPDQEP